MSSSTRVRRRKRLPPAAARVGDHHVCLLKTQDVAHKGGEILSPGASTVLIGEMPAARVGDYCWCDGDAFDVIVEGDITVTVGSRPLARAGDQTDGGYLHEGMGTVRIGRAR